MLPSVSLEKTTPQPNVSSGRFLSKTLISTRGNAFFMRIAKYRPAGPPPTLTIFMKSDASRRRSVRLARRLLGGRRNPPRAAVRCGPRGRGLSRLLPHAALLCQGVSIDAVLLVDLGPGEDEVVLVRSFHEHVDVVRVRVGRDELPAQTPRVGPRLKDSALVELVEGHGQSLLLDRV